MLSVCYICSIVKIWWECIAYTYFNRYQDYWIESAVVIINFQPSKYMAKVEKQDDVDRFFYNNPAWATIFVLRVLIFETFYNFALSLK